MLPLFAAERLESELTSALLSWIEICSTPKLPSRILRPHLSILLPFALSLINPSPYAYSPHHSATPFDETVRAPAVELLVSICEFAPTLVKSHPTFIDSFIPTLLNLMTERDDDPEWVKSEDFNGEDEDTLAATGESGMDRLSLALGESARRIVLDCCLTSLYLFDDARAGDTVFNPTLLYANQHLISSPVWQHRYAALSAIASIAEGCIDLVHDQMGPLIG